MQDAVQAARAPVHLWIVGILATLWNAFGCYDYIMTQTGNRYAVHAFGASLVGMIVGLAYQRFGMVIPESLTTGVMAVMPWVIFAIGIALFVYARTQAAKGVLR